MRRPRITFIRPFIGWHSLEVQVGTLVLQVRLPRRMRDAHGCPESYTPPLVNLWRDGRWL